MTKEPKLVSAVRIVKEWQDYDNEIKQLQERVSHQINKSADENSKILLCLLMICYSLWISITALLFNNAFIISRLTFLYWALLFFLHVGSPKREELWWSKIVSISLPFCVRSSRNLFAFRTRLQQWLNKRNVILRSYLRLWNIDQSPNNKIVFISARG